MKFIEVNSTADAELLIRTLPDVVAIDTEYVPGDPRTTNLIKFIIADEDRAWVCLPSLLPILTPTIRARKLIFLQDYNHCDTIILKQHGCDLRGVNVYNLIDMHHLIDENAEHSLGDRVMDTYKDDYKTRLKGQFDDLEYMGKDGIYTYRLGVSDLRQLEGLGKLNLYEHVRRTGQALLDTELEGLNVNVELIKSTEIEVREQIDLYLPKLREEFKDHVNLIELDKWHEEIVKRKSLRGKQGVKRPEFSFASDSQLSHLLYDVLKLPVVNTTKKGNPSTDYDTLKELSETHPEVKSIFEYKNVKTIYSTFIKGMLERIDNGRIYPHFNVSGTKTGRISHTNPNMGNLPTDGVIRNFFTPTPGYSLVGADYAQLEVVVEANLTGDKNLLKIINEGVSKHDITAQGLGISRNAAKTLNFALQYGAGIGKVKRLLNCSEASAEDIYERYWELYSGVRALKEATCKNLQEKGEVTNLFGRTRHFPKTKNKYKIFKQQRQAYNFLIQGVASDACNRAFWRYHEGLKVSRVGRTLFSVHDEIVVEVQEGFEDLCKLALVETMEDVSIFLNLKYPLKAKAYGPLKFWTKT